MLDKIAPGSTINVKVVKQPTNAAASKTLMRVLAKDPGVAAEHKRQAKLRKVHYNPQPRGGRLYGGQLVKQHPVKGKIGEAGTVTATADVLRDLGSVKRFIEVSQA
jgi:hypothetical protein